jgi:microcystin-dependent protein
MVDQYVGEIKLVGFNFAPLQWAQCAGQLVPISQNPSLFALLGTMYGGNGTSTFGLPDLRGRAAGHVGPNLYTAQGMLLGTETVSLNTTEYPSHSHQFNVGTAGSAEAPLGDFLSSVAPTSGPPSGALQIYTPLSGATLQALNSGIIGPSAGNSQPHENMMPYLAMTYCIALQGVFPPRS